MEVRCAVRLAGVLLALAVGGRSGVCFAGTDVPTAEEILDRLGASGKTINLDSLTSGTIAVCLKVIRFLQVLSVPVAVVLLIVAAGMFAAGALGHNEAVKRNAVGIAVCTAVGFTLVRLAPVLVAVMIRAAQ
ncbi:MAG: hypothetical protein ACPLPR_01450 [Bacillota bacterium]